MKYAAIAFAIFALAACGADPSDDASRSSADASADQVDIDVRSDAPSVCGNGIVEANEECDDGDQPNVGCKSDCTAFCSDATDCDDAEPCNGNETCKVAGTGRACANGTPPVNGSACTGGYCKNGTCTQPVCGNSVKEPGEACDPPGVAPCSQTCQICGDGAVGAGEDCDDGNLVKLDGCDGNCRYEAVMRFDNFTIGSGPSPSFCVHSANTYGTALSKELSDQLSTTLNAATSGGLNNLMVTIDGLDDLTPKTRRWTSGF